MYLLYPKLNQRPPGSCFCTEFNSNSPLIHNLPAYVCRIMNAPTKIKDFESREDKKIERGAAGLNVNQIRKQYAEI